MGKGGKERRLYELIRKLKSVEGISFSLLTLRAENDFPDLANLAVPLNSLTRSQSKSLFIKFIRFFLFIKNWKPDLVHSWGSLNTLFAVLLKPIFGYKIIDNQITSAPKDVKNSFLFYTIPFTFSELVVSNSIAGLKSYKAPKNKSKVIYNGFDFNRIRNLRSKNIIRSRLVITSNFIVGMFANLTHAKNYKLFFTVAQIVLTKRNDVTFICAGKGDFNEYLLTLTTNIKDRVRVLGQVHEVEQLMSICDIGLQLTNINGHGEGISNSILELCALGKCVIATDCGGTSEIIQDKINGFLIDDNADYISDLISSLLDDNIKRDEIGAEAVKVIAEKFSIENMVDEYRRLYLE